KVNLDSYTKELRRLKEDFNVTSDSGDFSLRAPALVANAARLDDPLWKVLNGNDFKAELEGKPVKPGDPLLQIGDINGVWEVEIKIPQKHIGQVYAAFAKIDQDDELDVDLKLESHVTKTYRGKLARNKVSPQAVPNKDDHNETEPVVYAWVRVSGDGIAEEDQIPLKMMRDLAGVGVRGKVRCGKYRMGYSLFYGV